MLRTLDETAPFPIFLRRAGVRNELRYRLKQQSLLAEFSRAALQSRDLQIILQRATELCAEGLDAPFAAAMEFAPDVRRLIVRAGVGWAPNTIDHASLPTDAGSPAGYAFQNGQTVICNDLSSEPRFQRLRVLADHGIQRSINVPIKRGANGSAFFGVLEVDSPEPGRFDEADATFLAGFAGLVGIAVERHNADARLQEAFDYQAMLTREMSHRVKNSLSSVVAMLHIQSRSTQSDDVRRGLQEAGSRVATIAQVHDHLSRGTRLGFIDLAVFMDDFCSRMHGAAGTNVLCCHADAIQLSADHALPLGLLINELVTNAVKHAYPGGHGAIDVSAHETNGCLHVEVSDHGIGLPAGFDIDQPRASLGFRIIKGLVRQLRSHLTILSNTPSGTRFLFELPLTSGEGAPTPNKATPTAPV
ncbi:histidine kinase [Bradyrhizobium sp. SSBR45G]|uniref:sensor histidine kinase n=2 Tax=unclassified Bradyrhizobium TaxID=2631580 RepID=UPI002342A496|nr:MULTISPECIES: GAF domain-containing protein [unclassified Bradyrhizobium]GLH81492.1 histidine kinase [Bradyrhizobium sp. SSBR45G]GLH88899.1 histidine kinase [Bradyrhizobium sp. SSBR45R]